VILCAFDEQIMYVLDIHIEMRACGGGGFQLKCMCHGRVCGGILFPKYGVTLCCVHVCTPVCVPLPLATQNPHNNSQVQITSGSMSKKSKSPHARTSFQGSSTNWAASTRMCVAGSTGYCIIFHVCV
jgi:hypothetical protein